MDNSMKITVGLGSIDEYERFVQAGADEFFCGYVPFSWAEKYGTVMPLNRREVFCYNVQLGAYSELEILSRMVKKYKKPVHLTFNSLYYLPEHGDRRYHREVHGNWISKLYHCRSGASCLSEKQGTFLRDSSQWRNRGSEQRNAENVPALSSEEIDLSSEKHVPGYAVCYCISERGGETGRDPTGGGNGVRGLRAE